VHYTFDDGFEGFTNRWGDTEHVTLENGDGAITVTSNAGEWNDSGAMMQGEGYGYGLYEFTTKVNSDAPGGYALLWPQDDVWPGAELDVFEQLPGGQAYSTIHWDANPGSDGNDDNAYESYFAPEGIDTNEFHTWAINWQPDYIEFYVDGERYAHTTSHVPPAAVDGGVDSAPGVGEQTWWSVDHQTGTNTLWLTDFNPDFPYGQHCAGANQRDLV
jgi:beta-glucanase (GH16 family)